ncbi:MAG: hypothetical protein AAFX93_08150 [Verrucomicrobiota bacterium]
MKIHFACLLVFVAWIPAQAKIPDGSGDIENVTRMAFKLTFTGWTFGTYTATKEGDVVVVDLEKVGSESLMQIGPRHSEFPGPLFHLDYLKLVSDESETNRRGLKTRNIILKGDPLSHLEDRSEQIDGYTLMHIDLRFSPRRFLEDDGVVRVGLDGQPVIAGDTAVYGSLTLYKMQGNGIIRDFMRGHFNYQPNEDRYTPKLSEFSFATESSSVDRGSTETRTPSPAR